MKPYYLISILALIVMLTSCGEEKTAAPHGAESDPSVSSPAVENSPSPQASQPAAKPVVNVGELNKDLLTAITFNQPDKALAAIEAGATPEATNRYGLPVIFMAAQMGDSNVVKALLDAGADANAKIGTSFNDDGVGYAGTSDGTVLGYAAAKGHAQVMQDLVKAGADVNGSGPAGTTPLMQAVDSGNFEIVKWLIDAGADPNAKNATGGTALGTAQMIINPYTERQQIIDLLKQQTR